MRGAAGGCITIGRAGEQLAPFAELAAAGVQIFTDDGNGVQDPLLMRRALEYALGLGITLAQHCEVAPAHRGRGDARGPVLQPARPARLAVDRRGADGPSATSSCPGSPVRRCTSCTCRQPAASTWSARRRPTVCAVTAEAAPHHFTLTDELLRRLRPVYKVNPPLRTI